MSFTDLPGKLVAFMNHNISIQSKIVQELFVEVQLLFVLWLRMTSEFFHPLSHLLRLEKLPRISLFPIKQVVRS